MAEEAERERKSLDNEPLTDNRGREGPVAPN
jgi:hypothetical protein